MRFRTTVHSSRLTQLRTATRRFLGISLLAATVAYFGLLLATYLQLTPSGSTFPDLRALNRLLFGGKKPVSRIERLLESNEGPLSRSGTMRPAFTEQSDGWESLVQGMTAEEEASLLADREGERLAMLDWVRSGSNREAYERDQHELTAASGINQITAKYVIDHQQSKSRADTASIRIRTLLADRCVTCHGEHGRHDIARFIELDTYQGLEPHLGPEPEDLTGRGWLRAALLGLDALAVMSAPLFLLTNHSPAGKRALVATTFIALAIVTACWLAAKPASNLIYPLLASAATATLAIAMQTIATLGELLTDR